MMDEPDLVERCAHDFADDLTSTALIRHLHFVSQTIRRLENEIDKQKEEFAEVIEYAVENQVFRQKINRIVRSFRRRYSQPWTHRVSTSSSPSLQSNRTSSGPLPSTANPPTSEEEAESPTDDPPRTVRILSPISRESSLSSYCTAIDNPPTDENNIPDDDKNNAPAGSSLNPIDVDALDDSPNLSTNEGNAVASPSEPPRDTPHPGVGMLIRRRTLPNMIVCPNCTRSGHTFAQCIYDGPLACEYCQRLDHVRWNCPVLRSDMARYTPGLKYCEQCQQTGHDEELCQEAFIQRYAPEHPSQ
jgi:hypothetical protein